MRKETKITAKFQEQCCRHLKERKQKYLCVSPLNCVHNVRHRVKQKGMIGFCENPIILEKSKRHVVVCEGDVTASACFEYECVHTTATVESDFHEILRNPSRCGQEYPRLGALIWCLQDGTNGNAIGEAIADAIGDETDGPDAIEDTIKDTIEDTIEDNAVVPDAIEDGAIEAIDCEIEIENIGAKTRLKRLAGLLWKLGSCSWW